jgi:hypothetical protein
MKKMTLKGKIATGVVAASIIGTSTFAFASTTAGGQFKAWGQDKIDAAMETVSQNLADDTTTASNQINTDANTGRDAAEEAIDNSGETTTTTTTGNIDAKVKAHMKELTDALAEFMSSIGGDFDDFVEAENEGTSNTLEAQRTALKSSINSVLSQAHSDNLTMVTNESLLAKGTATAQLIQKINEVKSDLSDEVTSQQNIAQGEVDQYLSDLVDDINTELENLIKTLKDNAIAEIEAEGARIQQSAYDNFDRVINLIDSDKEIEVDEQSLVWNFWRSATDKKVNFTVVNQNAFDVVFQYKFVSKNVVDGGVSETPYAGGFLQPGTTTLSFDVEQYRGIFGINFDEDGELLVEYLDENGNVVSSDVVGWY